MADKIIRCRRCGQTITAQTLITKYCTKCARMNKKEQDAESRKRRTEAPKPKPKQAVAHSGPLAGMSIAQIAALAREAGVTYGQYVERMEG